MDNKRKEHFPQREERVRYQGTGNVEAEHKTKRKTKRTKNSKTTKSQRTNKARKNDMKMKGIMAGGVLLLVLILFFAFFHKNGTEVSVGENSIGILKDTSVTTDQLKETLEAQLAETVGTKVQINEKIVLKRLHINGSRKKEACTMEYLMPKLKNVVTYKVEASVVFVDGGAVAPLATKPEADKVLEKLKEPYLPQDENSNAEIGFLEKVEIQSQFVSSEEILSVESAVEKLTSTTPVTKTHTVREGDTLQKIAIEYEMSMQELLEVNDGMTIKTPIRVGQTLNVTVQKPMVSIKSVETQVLTTVEKKQYQTQYDNSKPASYQRVAQQGKDGQKKSTIQITRVNGFVIEEKEVSKEITQEAIPEIIVKGTQ